MTKLSQEEKRLQKIRLQLYGKENDSVIKPNQKKSGVQENKESGVSFVQKSVPAFQNPSPISEQKNQESQVLKRDLFKVLGLSATAFVVQFGIYFAIRGGILPRWF